ncbi:MAG: hypothetical protein FD166_1993 [Bacteroidetes bacterium]|nr:MAG: hypothetical protein FD166_1993 [Bacteroidota bacterium]
MLPILSVLVILFPFLRVAQYFVGFIDLLKIPFCILIIGVEVGMELPGKLPVGSPYFFRRCFLLNA